MQHYANNIGMLCGKTILLFDFLKVGVCEGCDNQERSYPED